MKTLLETLKAGTGYLEKRGIDEARLNMEHLLAHVLQCRRLELYLRFGEVLHEEELEALRILVKRRGEGEPLQHLLGSVEFSGHELVCDHRALVPRPETERLVEMLIERLDKNVPSSVLDVGTGSGCIGLSLAKAWHTKLPSPPTEAPIDEPVTEAAEDTPAKSPARPNYGFTLIDISEDALELARLNASRLGLNGAALRFLRSDLFEKVDGEFDLIVANLPYIPSAEISTLSQEVRRDPVLALDGGAIGTEIIARLISEAPLHLRPGGLLALELGHDQAPAVIVLCQSAGLIDAQAERDLQGVERFVLARRQTES